jgi:WD40 repeat protein
MVRKLAFSTDAPTTTLFAAGDDKSVHMWHIGQNPHDASKPLLTYIKSLRWEFSRGPRGMIVDMDVSRGGGSPFLTIGGYGAREGYNLALFDLNRGELTSRLATGMADSLNVDSVSLSPGGKKLAVVDRGGGFARVSVWRSPDPSEADQRWKRDEVDKSLAADFDPSRSLPVRFLTERWLAVPQFPRAREKETFIRLFDLSSGAKPTPSISLLTRHSAPVTSLALAAEGEKWASADMKGAVYIWGRRDAPPNGDMRPTILRPAGEGQDVAASLAFSPDGRRLLIGNLAASDRPSIAEIWDLTVAPPKLTGWRHRISSEFHTPSVAWSPDGRWIATFHPETQEIQLLGADEALDGRVQVTSVEGTGKAIRHVAFDAKNPGKIGFTHSADRQFDRSFDFATGNYQIDGVAGRPAAAWEPTLANDGGWELNVGLDKARRPTQLTLTNRGVSYQHALDPVADGQYECHAWIRDKNGLPSAIAIGTRVVNGIQIYRLPADTRTRPTLLRVLRDHNGPVMSLSVSGDRRLLASASHDQTIKIWSLDGLEGAVQRAEWGADIVRDGQRILIRNVVPAGILAVRGLRSGDQIVSLDAADGSKPRTAADILRSFPADQFKPGQITIDAIHADGSKLSRLSVNPGWVPLVTLFTESSGINWVMFTPDGYYDSSVLEGESFLSWLMNDGKSSPPRVLRATSLEKQFRRSETVRKVLQAGSLDAAFAAAGQRPAVDEDLQETIGGVPLISVTGPHLMERLSGQQEQRITAQIRFLKEADWTKYKATISVNAAPIESIETAVLPPGPDGSQTIVVTADAGVKADVSATGLNLMQIQVDSPSEGDKATTSVAARSAYLDSANGRVIANWPLYFLGMGVNNYQGAAKARPGATGWDPLQYAEADANAIIESLKELHKSPKAPFELKSASNVVLGENVTRDAVSEKVNALKNAFRNSGRLDPNALIVVFLSGHGDVKEGEFYFVTPACRDSQDLPLTAIRWSDFEPLMTLPCQKLFLIDACRSGSIGNLAPVIQAMKRHSCMVITSVTNEANSFEDPDHKNGLFTYVLLEGLKGKAIDEFATAPQDLSLQGGGVTISNLYQFLIRGVPARAKKLGKYQLPYGFPHEVILSNVRPISPRN